jgi:hypothetical protein
MRDSCSSGSGCRPAPLRPSSTRFPRAPWSEPVYDDVASLLDEHAVRFERVPAGAGAVTEFLVADFGADAERAQRLATALLTRVYRVVPERDCVATLEGDFSSRALAGTRGRR